MTKLSETVQQEYDPEAAYFDLPKSGKTKVTILEDDGNGPQISFTHGGNAVQSWSGSTTGSSSGSRIPPRRTGNLFMNRGGNHVNYVCSGSNTRQINLGPDSVYNEAHESSSRAASSGVPDHELVLRLPRSRASEADIQITGDSINFKSELSSDNPIGSIYLKTTGELQVNPVLAREANFGTRGHSRLDCNGVTAYDLTMRTENGQMKGIATMPKYGRFETGGGESDLDIVGDWPGGKADLKFISGWGTTTRTGGDMTIDMIPTEQGGFTGSFSGSSQTGRVAFTGVDDIKVLNGKGSIGGETQSAIDASARSGDISLNFSKVPYKGKNMFAIPADWTTRD